ncbi:MAG: peptide chain release factor N(5)-glutamine methyltransferase [Candidatus Brocadiaceae bacterium]|nr:peptide chain release factor N(5)-glutamine methyltransferase [Candidatus Brocadiaceae bacterium]
MINTHDPKTIRNTIQWAIADLKESGIDLPVITADTLLCYTLSCDRTRLYTNPDEPIDDDVILKYKSLINKRKKHIPLQYITRQVEFMSLDFVVNEHVLIPRPETEILVETVLDKAHNDQIQNKKTTIMDIGTGSGNISISLAKNLTNAEIYASDISQDALTIAKTNAQKHNVLNCVHFIHGDLFSSFKGSVEKGEIDFIVSNPPYVSKSEWHLLEPEVRDHEPWKALVGGEDGLHISRQIIKKAIDWLKPGGYIIIEIGETQARSIINLLENEGRYKETEIINDLQGKERIISAQRS